MSDVSVKKPAAKPAGPQGGGDALKDQLGADPLNAPPAKVAAKAEAPAEGGGGISGFFGKLFNTKAYQASQAAQKRSQIRDKLSAMTTEQVMAEHWDLFYAFTQKEFSNENLDFIKAVDAGLGKEFIWSQYVEPGRAEAQVNLPGSIVSKLSPLAAQGKFDSMDFTEARAAILAMVAKDTKNRWVMKDETVDAIAARG